MQSLARDYVKIKMDRAEVESKAGGGATTMVHKSRSIVKKKQENYSGKLTGLFKISMYTYG